jgi:hypothetical protein
MSSRRKAILLPISASGISHHGRMIRKSYRATTPTLAASISMLRAINGGKPGSYYPPYRLPGGKGIPARTANFPPLRDDDDPYLTDMLTNHAVKFVKRRDDRPLFLFMSYYAVHAPFEGHADLTAKYASRPIKGSLRGDGRSRGPEPSGEFALHLRKRVWPTIR